MRTKNFPLAKSILVATLCFSPLALAESVPYSPTAGRDHPTRVYWGDTHIHTRLSSDAAAYGNRLGLDEAYRFARGDEVVSSTQQKVRLNQPLDFVVVADHSDGAGLFDMLAEGTAEIMREPLGQRWHKMIRAGELARVARELIGTFSQGEMPWATNDPVLLKPVWHKIVEAAERYNTPGTFTSFVGYEWTSLVRGNNLHRVVIYRDGAEKTRDILPYTMADSDDPEDLWAYLAQYENDTGGSVLAIPHNGNLSNGLMFADETRSGDAYSKDYLQRRQRWEPLYEITQIKGDGETHPLLSPDDEFADYETWDAGNLDLSEAKIDTMLRYEYAREALKRGLGYRADKGVNPFQFGVIGSTDTHTALSAVEENNFFGKFPTVEPSATRYAKKVGETDQGTVYSWQYVASGYAAVWAQENTREALWDAMNRREAYGTTGSRMVIRLFGGWDFQPQDARSNVLADVGYRKGVPMGAVLEKKPDGKTPTFLVAAQRDPLGANLDRIQIVKGWRSKDGKLHEKVYNVAWGGDRKLDNSGKLPAIGSTVDIKRATWNNTIGAPDLATVWQDPGFDAEQQAFYYARVIEIPTPRWTAFDAARFDVTLPDEVPMTTQERGYTSPIWYTP